MKFNEGDTFIPQILLGNLIQLRLLNVIKFLIVILKVLTNNWELFQTQLYKNDVTYFERGFLIIKCFTNDVRNYKIQLYTLQLLL